jgi:hypothetical protein
MMQHRLGVVPESLDVGEADAVDSGRLVALPSPPNEPGCIDQERGVVALHERVNG